jgi:hypothetical protein
LGAEAGGSREASLGKVIETISETKNTNQSAEGAAQEERACLAFSRSWVQFPGRKTKLNQNKMII